MKSLPLFVAECFVVTVLGLCSTAALEVHTLPPGTTAIHDLPYIPSGRERQKLDLYIPAGIAVRPLAIFIHGGGFSGGDKHKLEVNDLHELLKAGIAVASLNYRFYDDAPLPAACEDCARAVQYLRFRTAD